MGKDIVSINGRFEWDEEKNILNKKKHGLSFEDVIQIFDDPLFYEQLDEFHSTDSEIRYIGMARLYGFTVIVSCYTERERVRLFSARVATSIEEKKYDEWCRQFI